MNREDSFTLIELLIVIGILAILATVVIVVINPTELIKQARDSTRLSDLGTLNTGLQVAQTQSISFFGTSSIVYVSIFDSTSTCANLGLPTLLSGWSYNCAPSSTLTKVDGSGWVPVNFTQMTIGVPFSNLPIDPINTTSSGNYYTYTPGGSWELTAVFESQKYQSTALKDGGDSLAFYEVGTNLTLAPSFTLTSGSITQTNTHLSIVNGTAFADLLGLNLAPYLGAKLTITDSASKTLVGYIKAAGTGETLDIEAVNDPGYDNVPPGSWNLPAGWVLSEGRAVVNSSAEHWNVQAMSGWIVGALYKMQITVVSKTGGTAYIVLGNSGGVGPLVVGLNQGYGTVKSDDNFGVHEWSLVGVLDDISGKRVLTPSTTGVTISSTPGGVQNWTSEQTGFIRNDSSGYTYKIER